MKVMTNRTMPDGEQGEVVLGCRLTVSPISRGDRGRQGPDGLEDARAG